jgi:predicted NAD/FAD-binding protein
LRVAIVGSGISGLTAAHLLHEDHEITLFEAGDHVGGHARTVRVEIGGREHDVDTGFVVYNETTYPILTRLLARLRVETQPTAMSFGVSCRRTGVEYCGTSLRTVFADPRNLLRPQFLRMLVDIVRFNRRARQLVRAGAPHGTLGDVLADGRYSRRFLEHYLVPMGAAIWSCDPARILEFPASFFLRFFDNHGLLRTRRQLPWRVVRGGSRRYVEALIRPFRDRIRLRSRVVSVRRDGDGVTLVADGAPARFDHAVVAVHGDQALPLLSDATDREREILGAIRYQRNDAVLHTDARLLPARARARASWNYRIPRHEEERPTLTYDMTRLQGLDAPEPICVSLNSESEIDPARVLDRVAFEHPVFDAAAAAAQRRHGELGGAARVHFCGAYWGSGFHEDGARSAVAACRWFGKDL